MGIIIGVIGLVLLFVLGMVIGYSFDKGINPLRDVCFAILLIIFSYISFFKLVDVGRADAERDFLNGKYELRYETRVVGDSIIKIDSSYVLKNNKNLKK